MENNIVESLEIPMQWNIISKNEYSKYHIISTADANVVCSWFTAIGKDKKSIVTLYNYGNDKGFINDLNESFEEIKESTELQEQYGIIPVRCKKIKIGKNVVFFCSIKTSDFSGVSVDMYFNYEGTNYALHTVVDSLDGEDTSDIIFADARLNNIYKIIKAI